MKKYFLFIAIFTAYCSFGQTKVDTENWITYYLNKYFSDCTYLGRRERSNYYFLDGKLIKYSSEYCCEYSNFADTPIEVKSYSIDLSRIYKVYLEAITLKSTTYNLLSLDFDMKYYKPTVSIIDIKTGQTNMNGIPIGISFMSSDQEVSKENILHRLKKAFEHLATLDGASLLKESF